ncbi:hypothetical protein DWUX_2260 [Desulfovibrio diazotrophicus]|nr:hypothetical protein DWUX_2260 [Desulfovibrio diazotrophicus]
MFLNQGKLFYKRKVLIYYFNSIIIFISAQIAHIGKKFFISI